MILDANCTMAKRLGGDGQLQGKARMQAAKESIRMLLEQKVSYYCAIFENQQLIVLSFIIALA